jgi:ribosomal protein L6P/L9E
MLNKKNNFNMYFIKIIQKFKKLGININYFFDNNLLYVKGPLGIICYKLNLKYFYLIKNNNLFLINKNILATFFKDFEKLIIGVTYGWFFNLNIIGRGFNFKLETKNNNNYLRIKIGYSHFIYYKLTSSLWIKMSKKKNKLFVFGLNFWEINKIANQLRALRSAHTYKIQGISFFNESIIVKPGKQKQA